MSQWAPQNPMSVHESHRVDKLKTIGTPRIFVTLKLEGDKYVKKNKKINIICILT